MSCAADVQYQRYEKRNGKVVPVVQATDADPDSIYREEKRKLGFDLADYYYFSKTYYQHTILRRNLIWEFFAIWAGVMNFLVPFVTYGYGISNISGKNEDFSPAAFSSFLANFLCHHL